MKDGIRLHEVKAKSRDLGASLIRRNCPSNFQAGGKPLYQARESILIPFHLLAVNFLQKIYDHKKASHCLQEGQEEEGEQEE